MMGISFAPKYPIMPDSRLSLKIIQVNFVFRWKHAS